MKTKRTLEIEAIITGDGECFCLYMDKENYLKAVGPNEWMEDDEIQPGLYKAYPNHLLVNPDNFNDRKMKLTIISEEVE